MKKALYGYGGHAREVAFLMQEDVTFFVSDEFANDLARPISSIEKDEYEIMIAIADPVIRKSICENINGIKYFTFIHPTAIIGNDVKIGEGSYVGPHCIITTNVKIGKHSIISRFNSIGHDVVCKDFLSMMPGSVISGNNSIGECVYIGTNSSFKEKIQVCDNLIIGLNSGVVTNIKESGTYVGTPSVKIK